MKYLLTLLLLTTSAFSADKILGYKSYKLGKKIRGETQQSSTYAHIKHVKKSHTLSVVLVGDEDRKCISVRVYFSFKVTYKDKTVKKAYSKFLAKAIKKYGAGAYRRRPTDRGAEYLIIQPKDNRILRIKRTNSRIHVFYSVVSDEEIKKHQPEREENFDLDSETEAL